MNAGTYSLTLVGGESVRVEVVSLGEREVSPFGRPEMAEAFEPDVLQDESGIGFHYEDGCWRFFPWGNVIECCFAPAPAGVPE